MEYRMLGKTGIFVSRMCFGALTIGPLQANLPLAEGAALVAQALEAGVNFFDTAQLYGTYPYLREGMRLANREAVISSKTYAWNRELAVEAVEQARRELNRDVVDIFMLHEQESALTMRGHREALEALWEYKQKGIIRAVGASMHHVAAVYGAIEMNLDVIHPLLNIAGLGIGDGTRQDMEAALAEAAQQGIGIFTMKPLGGGNLFRRAEECLDYILQFPYADSVAIGIQSGEELAANIEYWQSGTFSPAAQSHLAEKTRRLHIDSWCVGCGQCVVRCGQKALVVEDNRAVCRHERCLLCGYCATVCPEWAIKIV